MKLEDIFEIVKNPSHPQISIKKISDGFGKELVVPLELLEEFIQALEKYLPPAGSRREKGS